MMLPVNGNFELYNLKYENILNTINNKGFKNKKTNDHIKYKFTYYKNERNILSSNEQSISLLILNDNRIDNHERPINEIRKIEYFKIINPSKNLWFNKFTTGLSYEKSGKKSYYCLETKDNSYQTSLFNCLTNKNTIFINHNRPLLVRSVNAITIKNFIGQENLNWNSKTNYKIGLETNLISNENNLDNSLSRYTEINNFIPKNKISVINLIGLGYSNTKTISKKLGFGYSITGYLPVWSNYYHKKKLNDDFFAQFSAKISGRLNQNFLLSLDFTHAQKFPLDELITAYDKFQNQYLKQNIIS